MSWIKQNGYNTDTDSRSWGNYSNSTGAAAEYSRSLQTSGKNEAWKANNVYDLAGNHLEWTQEASNIGYRFIRGRWLQLFRL